jgi:hypothetical protein
MKITKYGFVLGIFLCSASVGRAETAIFTYAYGNQVVGSHFVIYDNGRILHEEKNCCPPKVSKVDHDGPIAPYALENLKEIIEEAAEGEVTHEKVSMPPGTKQGGLYVTAASGKNIEIRMYDKKSPLEGVLHLNHLHAAKTLEEYANRFVKVKLPEIDREISPSRW